MALYAVSVLYYQKRQRQKNFGEFGDDDQQWVRIEPGKGLKQTMEEDPDKGFFLDEA